MSFGKRAFTLMEALTATGIVLVLAAVIWPVYRTAVFAAKGRQDLESLRQLTLATLLYKDANDRLPGFYQSNYSGLIVNGYSPEIVLQVRTSAALRSPLYYAHPDADPDGSFLGWAVNACLSFRSSLSNDSETVLYTGATSGVVANGRTRATIVLATLSAPDIMLYGPEADAQTADTYDFSQPFGAVRVRGGSNTSFADGHAKWFRPDQFRLPYNRSCLSKGTTWIGPKDGPRFSLEEE